MKFAAQTLRQKARRFVEVDEFAIPFYPRTDGRADSTRPAPLGNPAVPLGILAHIAQISPALPPY